MKKYSKINTLSRCLAVVAILIFTLVMFTACKEKGLDIIVYDYNTQEVMSTINSVDDEERFVKLNNAIFDSESTRVDLQYILSEEEAYSVLFEDPKDSTYDIWYKVVFENDGAYIKYDFEKMDEEYSETLKNMDFPLDYYECSAVTTQELTELLLTE